MNRRICIYPYKMSSSGSKRVASYLTVAGVDAIRVFADGKYKPRDGDLIFGWGAGTCPEWMEYVGTVDCQYINTWKSICQSVDKITAFRKFRACGVPAPEFTQSRDEAQKWVGKDKWVCVRHSIEGMDGEGLVLAKTKEQIEWAPLYTKFVKNQLEFRVYVFAGKVIDILKKVPTEDTDNEYIRTTSHHYEYARSSTGCTKMAQTAAINAVDAVDLVFAGVDLVIGEDGEPYVLETNTAPDIGGITAERIATALRQYAGL